VTLASEGVGLALRPWYPHDRSSCVRAKVCVGELSLFKLLGAAAALTITVAASSAAAAAPSIAAGETITGVNVAGTASIYGVFGHPGNPGGDIMPSLSLPPAVLTTFAAAAGNVFTFSARGTVSCCFGEPSASPDGRLIDGYSTQIDPANGLSGLTGNSVVPLVGVFTTDSDPFGGAAPASLSFDSLSPLSLSPLLNQIFYIGDGRAGHDQAAGASLLFAAPTTATRLYIGTIDGSSFQGLPGFYGDNVGSYAVDIHLDGRSPIIGGVPEPASWSLMILGFGAAGATLRTRRRRIGFAA